MVGLGIKSGDIRLKRRGFLENFLNPSSSWLFVKFFVILWIFAVFLGLKDIIYILFLYLLIKRTLSFKVFISYYVAVLLLSFFIPYSLGIYVFIIALGFLLSQLSEFIYTKGGIFLPFFLLFFLLLFKVLEFVMFAFILKVPISLTGIFTWSNISSLVLDIIIFLIILLI